MTPFWTFFGQDGGCLGIDVNKNHPVFKYFPNDGYGDWQWFYVINYSKAVDLSDFPKEFIPIITAIDSPKRNKKLSILFEVSVGDARLMVCSSNLFKGTSECQWLLKGISEYFEKSKTKLYPVSIEEMEKRFGHGNISEKDFVSNAIYVQDQLSV